jgi:hypothetical protein
MSAPQAPAIHGSAGLAKNNPYGCSCSFMVCGCAYPPAMMRIVLLVGFVLFMVAVVIIFTENYCNYADMEECYEAHGSYCEKLADEAPWYTQRRPVVQACLCRYCAKCTRGDSDKAAYEMMCRLAKTTTESTNNQTITSKVASAIESTASKYGISIQLY